MVAQGGDDPPWPPYEEGALPKAARRMAAALGIEPSSSGFKGPSDPRPAATNWTCVGVSIPLPSLERRRVLAGRRTQNGADAGNRTPVFCLEGSASTIEVTPAGLAEGRRHDHHTVASAISLAKSAGASPVDLP